MKFVPIAILLISITLLSPGTMTPQAAPDRAVTFSDVAEEIPPECTWCHGWEEGRKTGYFMDTYGGLIEGAFHDAVFHREIIPGDAEHSPLVQYIEGRRLPRMPSGRDPLPKETIKLIRQWIDQGAKSDVRTSSEHLVVIDHIPVSSAQPSFWLSCRAPKNEQNIGLRVKVIDDVTGKTVAYSWPTSEKDLNGRWSQWKSIFQKGQ